MKVWTKGFWTNRKNLRQGYLDHYAHVRAIVPRERLLEFHPDDGWTQLCQFLKKPIPYEEPYPHVNEGRRFLELHARLYWYRHAKHIQSKGLVLVPIGKNKKKPKAFFPLKLSIQISIHPCYIKCYRRTPLLPRSFFLFFLFFGIDMT